MSMEESVQHVVMMAIQEVSVKVLKYKKIETKRMCFFFFFS